MKWVFGADTKPFRKGLDDMRNQTKAFSGSIKGMIAGAIGVTAIVAGFKKAISAASALSEQMSKSKEVFGGHAKEVQAWAGGLAKSFGQSKVMALGAASDFGALFRVMGVGEKESSKMSKKLVELASDMSSFNDKSIEQTLTAIGAGLRGENEPLKAFGVNLNDATLKIKAMAMGLYEGKGALDMNVKMLAAYEIMLEQTSQAQGDFGRTALGAANAQKVLAAQAENAAAAMGGKLLPQYEKFLETMNSVDVGSFGEGLGAVVSGLVKVIRTIGMAVAFVVKFGISVVRVAGAVGSALGNLGNLIKSVFTFDFSGAKSAFNDFTTSISEAGEAVADEAKRLAISTRDELNSIWSERPNYSWGEEDKKSAEELIRVHEMARIEQEKMKKLAEEIAAIKKKAAFDELSAAEKINALEKGKHDKLDTIFGDGKESDKLQAEKEILEIEKKKKDIADKLAKKKDKADKKSEDLADKKAKAEAKYTENINKANEREADNLRDIAFDNSTDSEKIAMLEKERKELLADSGNLEGRAALTGDAETKNALEVEAIDKRTEAASKGAQIDDILTGLNESKIAGPTIATSSLASIGAGGSANLLGNTTTEQRKVSLLEIIAQNTGKTETGSTKIPEPI